jgi:5-methylcytosine-specific restriction endonuclease McrA
MASTARRRAWNGRRVTELKRYILARDGYVCGICGHLGADTIGHLVPFALDPTRLWDTSNMQAQHGRKHPEYGCPGNYSEGSRIRAEARRRERENAEGTEPASSSRPALGRPYVPLQPWRPPPARRPAPPPELPHIW